LPAATLYTYAVRAFDAAGNLSAPSANASATTFAPPDTTPPQVLITFPANNAQLSNIVTVTADASDNVGVAGVQFSSTARTQEWRTARHPTRTRGTRAPFRTAPTR